MPRNLLALRIKPLTLKSWQQLEPARRLVIWVFLFSLILPAVLAGSIFCMAQNLLREQGRQWELGVTRSLACQLSQALAAQDDLQALNLLRAAHGHYPQLREGMAFDQAGTILWHTDSSRIGRKCAAFKTPALPALALASSFDSGRPLTSIQMPLSEDAGAYVRLVFDERRWSLAEHLWILEILLLLLLLAGGITFAGHWHLRSFVVFDRGAKIPLPDSAARTPAAFSLGQQSPDSECGQALLELILALGLFALFLNAAAQLAFLGAAHVQCQLAARRAAWLWNTWNNAGLDKNLREVRQLAPGCRVERVDADGSRETGMTLQAMQTVRAMGWVRLFRPNGFTVAARSAVIAYNPKPVVERIKQEGLNFVQERFFRAGGSEDDGSGP